MSMLWFTSDTHFGHAKILEHNRRPFIDVADMDAELIRRWNAVVAPTDTVWHLGDFSLWHHTDPAVYRSQLHGTIHLVCGNHDLRKHHQVWPPLLPLFASIQHVKYLRWEGHRFFLSHYAHRTWPRSHHGSFHLYGHSHGSLPNYGRSMDVGVDAQQYQPISIRAVVEQLSGAGATYHHSASGTGAR